MPKKNRTQPLPKSYKMHVKKGDTVQVISGKDKGKVGEIQRVIPTES
jgi:large subunit ribosomal protein L24